jgi:hypothetical protein
MPFWIKQPPSEYVGLYRLRKTSLSLKGTAFRPYVTAV